MPISDVEYFSTLPELEARRSSRAVILGAVNLDLDLLPALYKSLQSIGPHDTLDVVLYCRGGVVNASRRIALLFQEAATRLTFIVPFYCESSGTLLALSGDEVLASPLTIFSPIDPLLAADSGQQAISSQDVRLFADMAENWFKLEKAQAQKRAFDALTASIFPTTLTSFFRSTEEIRMIAAELFSRSLSGSNSEQSGKIIDKLILGYHSHSYALTAEELAKLGFPVSRDPVVTQLCSPITDYLRGGISGGPLKADQTIWYDAVIATTEGHLWRKRSLDSQELSWIRRDYDD